MGTTKDPEGFRRHTAGRGDVLGVKGGGAKRRGCGLGLGAVLALGLLGAAVWALRAQPEPRAVAAASPGVADRIAPEASLQLDTQDAERAVALQPLDLEPREVRRAAARADSRSAAVGAPAAPPRKLAAIRLLRAWSDVPLVDAQVRWLGRDELQRMRAQGLRVTTVSLAPVLTSRGRSAASDVDGLLRVSADGAHLLVEGDGWTRELEVRPPAEGLLDVRVFAPRALVVDVLDWRGQSAHGIPVEFWSVDALGVPQALLRSAATSPVSGALHLEDVDTWLGSARARVALDAGLAPDAWREIDLTLDPLPRASLRLPPLGELDVMVAQADGSPVEWTGHVELRVAEDRAGPRIGPLHHGRAHFANLRFGRELRAVAVRSDGPVNARGEERVLAALTPEAPARGIALADVSGSPRLRLRPLDPDGHVLPRTWIDVQIQASRALDPAELEAQSRARRLAAEFDARVGESGAYAREFGRDPLRAPMSRMDTWRRVLLTDARGTLDLPMPELALDGQNVRLVVSLLREGVVLASEPLRIPLGGSRADLDLGLVRLATALPAVATQDD